MADATLGTELPVLVCELRGNPGDEEQARLTEQVRERVLAELDVALADVCFARGLVERTTSGKVARSATRENYLAAGYRPQPPTTALSPTLLANPVALEVALLALAGQMIGVSNLGPHDNLFVTGADSLMMLRLVLAVEEQCEVGVPTEFFREPTVAHLVRLLAGEHLTAATPAVTPPITDAPAQPTVPRRPAAHPARRLARHLRATPQRMRVQVRSIFEAHAFRQTYFEGIQWLLNWCGRSWVQALLYPQESRLVRRFAESMGTPVGRVDREVRLSLASDVILRGYITETRSHAKTGQPKSVLITELVEALQSEPESSQSCQFFSVDGLGHLTQAIQTGNGVIAVGVHSPTRYAIWHYLPFWSVPQTALSRQDYQRRIQSLHLYGNHVWGAARSTAARDALKTLAQGGLVFIAGDEQNAEKGVPVTIGNRLHRLTPGFAELALISGASIVPIYTTLLRDGRICILISPPLVWKHSRNRNKEIEAIMCAYGRVQTETWRQMPSEVSKGIMAQHLRQPVITES
ncbi:phosphopantetheine-binding protein [Candidatus Chloroploca mongolica]|uniref:phosphopantetheine-binding protein n=1 Tax=Candidatus Chloroploca mongolica TaxID=2528176 RepID=UPI003530E1BA